MDFANTHAEDLQRFEQKWGEQIGKSWSDNVQDVVEAQHIVTSIWEGKFQGSEGHSIDVGLGLSVPRRDYRQEYDAGYIDSSMVLFHVSWEDGCIWASPRDLNDYVWLSLLQNSKRLAVCANKEGGCPAPYFIRSKPNQKFCSEVCALPVQRAFKRQWFREHGDEWRKNWLKKRKRHLKKTKQGRE